MPENQKRQLVPGKVVYPDDLAPKPADTEVTLQNVLNELKENPIFQDFENDMVSTMIKQFEAGTEKVEQAVNAQFPAPAELFEPVFLHHYLAQIRNEVYRILNRCIINAQRRFNEYIELPYIKKAQLPLTGQLKWLHETKIHNAAGRYFPFIDYIFDQAPKYINPKQRKYIDQTLRGAVYNPKDSKFGYTMATVETTPQFWAEALRTLPKTNGKIPQVRHGQKIVQRFIDCNLFDRIKVGPRNWAVIVGYYKRANAQKFYKVPLGTKRLSAGRLSKFKVF
jgi:hypothetical protein